MARPLPLAALALSTLTLLQAACGDAASVTAPTSPDAGASGGGDAGVGAPSGSGADGSADASADARADTGVASGTKFSFFITSLDTMRKQSGSQDGFGGDLGGLAGADAICSKAAADAGVTGKTWRAFLSAYNGGTPIHAIDRIGPGPWYDRTGRLVASDRAGLLLQRPAGDSAIASDLPDETGFGIKRLGDSHDVMTGSNTMGQLDGTSAAATCNDWTSAVGPGSENKVRCGHSWPANSGMHWIQAHRLNGCAPGVNLVQNGPGTGNTVGAGGGWGAIYCFALEP
jgi:hypothetical protein